jgi:hypothetical protein
MLQVGFIHVIGIACITDIDAVPKVFFKQNVGKLSRVVMLAFMPQKKNFKATGRISSFFGGCNKTERKNTDKTKEEIFLKMHGKIKFVRNYITNIATIIDNCYADYIRK